MIPPNGNYKWQLAHGLGPFCYLDGDEFKAYAALVEAVIHLVPVIPATKHEAEHPGLITVRAIHEILKKDARREWTQDALDSLKTIEAVGILPTRYRRKLGAAPGYKKIARSDSFKRIFPLKADTASAPARQPDNAEARA